MFLASESQIMRWGRIFTVSTLLFAIVALLPGSGKQAFAIKPSPPLNLSLTHNDLPDGQTELTLQAFANVAVEKVEISIDLPASLVLIAGETKWDGPLALGEQKEIKATIRTLSNHPTKVVGNAFVYFSSGGSLTQRARLLLNAPKEKPLSPRKPPILRKQGRDTILEFKEN